MQNLHKFLKLHSFFISLLKPIETYQSLSTAIRSYHSDFL
nr:MAG TPA: hypothetical protein [Caudoviricetes sp.]